MFAFQPGCHAQNCCMILGWSVHPSNHAHSQNSWLAWYCSGRFGESGWGQAIANNHDLVFPQSVLDQSLGCSARITNHAVTPPQHRGLSAPLRWGEQITQLSLAADHYWHPSKPGCGNQSEIGIEIEGVCDCDVTFAQMPRQPNPAAPGLHSVQTAAQPELWDFPQLT